MAQASFNEEKNRLEQALKKLAANLATIRTGRASPDLLKDIKVDYYGTLTPINQVAGIAMENAKTLLITPWDKNSLEPIEKAILASNLGLNPVNDGKKLRLIMPDLTTERRKELTKLVSEKVEEIKVSIRNIRSQAKNDLKKAEKEGQLSEDDYHRQMEELQKMIDDYMKKIDEIEEKKKKQILEF